MVEWLNQDMMQNNVYVKSLHILHIMIYTKNINLKKFT